MNGHGTRWLERLSRTARWCPAGAPYLRALPCFVRSLSHASRLLSRVRRRGRVPAVVDAAPDGSRHKGHLKQSESRSIARETCATDAPHHGKPQSWRGPIRELKDAEGRTYFTTGIDWGYHCRHVTSEEGGHVKAAYTARGTYLNPATKLLEYKKGITERPLLIMYLCDFVEDDEFWDENCVLCDFATAVTEREKCKDGYSPERDSRPVEFIIVLARFHYNAGTPDEPWHLTVDFGNRTTWNNGDGFFRRGYHIYVKNNDLSQGYAGYASPIRRQTLGRIDPMKHSEYLPRSARNSAEPGTSTSLDNTEATAWVPWGTREYYRNPNSRGYLHKTTHRSLKPPTVLSEDRARRTPGDKRKKRNPIQDELDDMVSCIRDGTSKPAIPSKGTFMIPGPSGNLVHVRQAVSDFRKAGKKIPAGWRVVLRNFYASERCLKKTARAPGETRARSAFDKTRRTTRTTTRSREGALKSKRLDRTGKSFRPGTERPQTNCSSTNNEDGGARLKGRPRVTAGPPKPKNSEAKKPESRPKLTIRDPFDTDAGVRQGVSASGELDSKDSRGERFAKSPDDGECESKGRSRRIMRRPKATTKNFDLGHALLNAAPEPGVSTHHRQGPKANKPASGNGSARPHTKRFQKSSLGKLMLDWDSQVSSGGGRSPRAPGPRGGKPGASGRQESGSDTRKAGKKTGSPLPPADADLVSESGKNMQGPYKAQRPKQTRASKTTPAWVLPRSKEEATSGEIHA